eukprot:Blabericola_migrator_1__4316@NODE_2325_length_2937_cov_19_200697_g1458_i0_p1_GENE_NODE_2325_length_2937_cov_19_200697_g1458_i0NODE_2325_length_2937_cov_19_200697_g1458_i0_p1_ORF_typecomplete_len475_score59_84_NODE_2325_length_2937_cov_19_200697_g1458_i01351559
MFCPSSITASQTLVREELSDHEQLNHNYASVSYTCTISVHLQLLPMRTLIILVSFLLSVRAGPGVSKQGKGKSVSFGDIFVHHYQPETDSGRNDEDDEIQFEIPANFDQRTIDTTEAPKSGKETTEAPKSGKETISETHEPPRPVFKGKFYEPRPGNWQILFYEAVTMEKNNPTKIGRGIDEATGITKLDPNDTPLFYILRQNPDVRQIFDALEKSFSQETRQLLIKIAKLDLAKLMTTHGLGGVSGVIWDEMERYNWNNRYMLSVAANVDDYVPSYDNKPSYALEEIVQVASDLYRKHNVTHNKMISRKWIKHLPLGLIPTNEADRRPCHETLFQSVAHFLDIPTSARKGLWMLVRQHQKTINKVPAIFMRNDGDPRVAVAEQQRYIKHIDGLWKNLRRKSFIGIILPRLSKDRSKATKLANVLSKQIGDVDKYEFLRQAAGLGFEHTWESLYQSEAGQHVLEYLASHGYLQE